MRHKVATTRRSRKVRVQNSCGSFVVDVTVCPTKLAGCDVGCFPTVCWEAWKKAALSGCVDGNGCRQWMHGRRKRVGGAYVQPLVEVCHQSDSHHHPRALTTMVGNRLELSTEHPPNPVSTKCPPTTYMVTTYILCLVIFEILNPLSYGYLWLTLV